MNSRNNFSINTALINKIIQICKMFKNSINVSVICFSCVITILLISAFNYFQPKAGQSISLLSTNETKIEIGFSPDAGSEDLVLKSINSAQYSINLAAYSFTSIPVTKALIAAKKRGVDVKLVVDYNSNLKEDRNGKSHSALNSLVNAGIIVRSISNYNIHHDKYMIIDEKNVETGSYNYSKSAALYNSENVIVIWNNPEVARTYLKHWQNRFDQGINYTPKY